MIYIKFTVVLKALFLAGVTGSGKTEIALKLSKTYNTYLISCDSVQIYNRLSILSNKPSDIASHSMLDFYNFIKQYDVIKYIEDVHREIAYCQKTNKIPIIVGGTGFYFSKLILEEFDVLKIFLTQKREILYERLDSRCEKMIMSGMIEEISDAKEEGLNLEHILGKSIGCRDGLIFIRECEKDAKNYEMHFDKFINNFKRRTRNYARKQENWFKKRDFLWIDIDSYDINNIIIDFFEDRFDSAIIKEIDVISRQVNENAAERMKTYVTAKNNIPDKALQSILEKILNKPEF